jgi:hypothetical protein
LSNKAWGPCGGRGRRQFPDITLRLQRARDRRGRDQRVRRVRSEARANTANVMSVILGGCDIASGLGAAKPRRGRTTWELQGWGDVGCMAFGADGVEGPLCVEKRTARVVPRLDALGLLEVSQIRMRDGEEWRSRVAVKRVKQAFWARVGLIHGFFAVLKARKRCGGQSSWRKARSEGPARPRVRPAALTDCAGCIRPGPCS